MVGGPTMTKFDINLDNLILVFLKYIYMLLCYRYLSSNHWQNTYG